MKTYYSGKNSKKFWNRINKLKKRKDELYSLGVLLQNNEDWILTQLENAEEEEK